MIYNKTFMISVFGSFQALEPTPEIMVFFVENFSKDGLMPSIFQEARIDGLNINAKKRIALISSDDSTKITIGQERIDYEKKFVIDKRLKAEELHELSLIMCEGIGKILEKYGLLSNRLAVNTQSFIICNDTKEVQTMLKQFSNPISFYSNDMPEWGTKLMVRKEIAFNGKNENCNIITNIDRDSFTRHVDGKEVMSDGFIVKSDINTVQTNNEYRFCGLDISEFANNVNEIWNEILLEMEQIYED